MGSDAQQITRESFASKRFRSPSATVVPVPEMSQPRALGVRLAIQEAHPAWLEDPQRDLRPQLTALQAVLQPGREGRQRDPEISCVLRARRLPYRIEPFM